ncbi:MAG: winged helix-turn-helix transcriptional regulator [Chryseobacterium taeanense]
MAIPYEKKLPPVLNNGLGKFFEVISGKWKAFLLFYINKGVKRPGQLQRMIPDADRRVLSQQLNELLTDGLLTRKIVKQKPLHVEYELTAMGESILPVLCTINNWGDFYKEENERRSHAEQQDEKA